jgi:formylglycine-generating enzyme required for sulfatase activity
MANNWAIIIGINHYDHHPERQLKYAVPDAQLIYDFLSTQAGFAPEHILLCLGDEAHRTHSNYPTYATLLRLLNRDLHPSRIGQVDRLWFFFGGHGVSQNGRDYLLTADSLLEDIELKIALPIDEVIASLRKHQSADIVLILDNCRQLQGSRKLSAGEVGKQTVELAHSRGITTIFSCDYGQYSYELESVKQGAFTYALVEGLKHHTLPDQLEQYLRRRVAELNQRHDQVPRVRVEPASKALQPLLPSAVTAADIAVLDERAREAELAENFETAKQLWWQVIEVAESGERIQEARTAIARIDQRIARSLVSQQWTRKRFLKWAGLGSAGLVTAVGGREIFKLATIPAVVSVAAPKYTQLNEEIAKGLLLWRVDFETVTVNARGRVANRFAKQANLFREDLGNGVTLEMVRIPGGSFQMGSPDLEEGRWPAESPQHVVSVPSFFMGQFAVTQAQYRAIIGNNPAHFKGENHPVEQVSWNNAVEFCAKLSQRTGRIYRLPSEAEWEYACRAGTTTPFYFGETITTGLANYAGIDWESNGYFYSGSYGNGPKGEWREKTTEVGTFPPNAFALYDMHGNIVEWCHDHWHDNYQEAPTDGSAWLSGDNNASRLIRGGSWYYGPETCRSACRYPHRIDGWYSNIGFRVVCSLA